MSQVAEKQARVKLLAVASRFNVAYTLMHEGMANKNFHSICGIEDNAFARGLAHGHAELKQSARSAPNPVLAGYKSSMAFTEIITSMGVRERARDLQQVKNGKQWSFTFDEATGADNASRSVMCLHGVRTGRPDPFCVLQSIMKVGAMDGLTGTLLVLRAMKRDAIPPEDLVGGTGDGVGHVQGCNKGTLTRLVQLFPWLTRGCVCSRRVLFDLLYNDVSHFSFACISV